MEVMQAVRDLVHSAVQRTCTAFVMSRFCFIVLLIFMAIYCHGPHERNKLEKPMTELNSNKPLGSANIAHMIGHLNNGSIRWDGTFVGLVPTIVSDSTRQLLASGDLAIPQLISALEDESKFVAAHVLLTLLSGVEYQTLPWNGLVVDIAADGTVTIDPAQKFDLVKRWKRWHQTEPRPRVLPSAD